MKITNRHKMSRHCDWLGVVCVLLALVLAGCGGGMDHGDMDHGDMEMGDGNRSENIQVMLEPSGYPGESLSVMLKDTDGNMITDAKVAVEGNMNHAGMVPVIADPVEDGADGSEDGVYQVPFAFTMGGDWIITVSAEMADGSMEMQDIMLVATEDGVEMK